MATTDDRTPLAALLAASPPTTGDRRKGRLHGSVVQKLRNLIVTGAPTSGCVRATIVDAVSYGWPTLVPRECVADRAQAPHDATLFDIDQKYADVVTADDVRTYLSQLSDRATGE